MAKEVIMPALGMVQETGLLMSWFKKPGDTVRKGEPLMEVETDKATVEIEAEADGILEGVAAAEGDSVPVGTVIAYIVSPSEASSFEAPGSPAPQAKHATEKERQASGFETTPTLVKATPVAARIATENHVDLSQITEHGRRITKGDVWAYLKDQSKAMPTRHAIPASPLARRMAREASLTLESVSGSGPLGAIIAEDVTKAIQERSLSMTSDTEAMGQTAGPNGTSSRRWQAMAERLAFSWQTVPHFYLRREVDASQLIEWMGQARERITVKVTLTDLLVMAIAKALEVHPQLNSSWSDTGIVHHEHINIGLAVAVEDGLLVPVIHDANTLSLTELASRRIELIERTMTEKLKPLDLQEGTFTLSNLGMYKIDSFDAVINPPQAAILAVGRVKEQVIPIHGQPEVRPMMSLTLSCDHRAVDGARGAQFLDTVAEHISWPLSLLD